MIRLGAHIVHGAAMDAQTRCVHYRSEVDVVAMRFHCCGDWYPCALCHDEAVAHARTVWPADDAEVQAALCGACAQTMSIARYRESVACPACGAGFNPRCALHHELYFA